MERHVGPDTSSWYLAGIGHTAPFCIPWGEQGTARRGGAHPIFAPATGERWISLSTDCRGNQGVYGPDSVQCPETGVLNPESVTHIYTN